MARTTERLDARVKFVDALAAWLAARVRPTPAGARSLAHLLVIVPTAQSGRRLRAALARKLGAVVPPAVRLPAQLVAGDAANVATRTDELIALKEAFALPSFDVAAQLSDIRRILGANALDFADVAAKVGAILTGDLADVEIDRWRKFAEQEKTYRAALARRGLVDRIAAMKTALDERAWTVPDEVEAIVLACVLEPLPVLNRWLETVARPVVELLPDIPDDGFSPLKTEQIVPCGTGASEAARVAELFASVRPDEALPALCLADDQLFPEVRGALKAKGLNVHNPSRSLLATSSLGHLAGQLAALAQARAYDVFSAFIRGGDVRRWLCAELKMTEAEMTDALNDLDHRQAELLPETMDDIAAKTKGRLRAIFEFVGVQLRKKTLRGILESIFRTRILDERDGDAREFVAAAEALNDLLAECFAPDLAPATALELFARRLREATYELEADEGDDIWADGWLELPFLDADELVVAGFQEGCVPESVVGHAFLPDALRRGLGLPDNASRARRDLQILNIALACRAPAAVTFLFHAIDAQGDVVKPSRLLFSCADDRELARRVRRFYGARAGTGATRAADLPQAWRLKLPDSYAKNGFVAFTSPSSLDLYLHCPFTFLLKKTFGERAEYDAAELAAYEFGNLIHDALEKWGAGALKESTDAAAIAAELAEHVDAWLAERFGANVPAIVALQGESAKRRLRNFAAVQVAWRAAGWRIVATEGKLAYGLVRAKGTTQISGRFDRVDFNDATGEWCVIDYKTWDTAERASAYDAKTGEWNSLQLPLYCAMMDADRSDLFKAATREKIKSAYCILGKTKDAVGFSPLMTGDLVPDAEKKIIDILERIERGIFWPPSPTKEWRHDFADWFGEDLAGSVDPEWLARQEGRLGDDGE